jgi:hypothetical protein
MEIVLIANLFCSKLHSTTMDRPSGSRSCITLEEFPVVSHLAIDSGHIVGSIRNFEVYKDVIGVSS